MTAWLTRAEAVQLIGARPRQLPYILMPFPVPVVVGGGLTLALFVVLGRN